MKKTVLILIIFLFTFNSCTKDSCSTNKNCTEEFRSIVVKINYLSSYPFLDYTKVYRKKDNKLIKEFTEDFITSTVIFNDSYLSETSIKGEVFILEGFENDVKIFSEEYVIKHDCCHVIKVLGKEMISL